MENVKKLICMDMTRNKKEVIKVHDECIAQIMESDNYVDLYTKFIDFYGRKDDQGDLGLNILKSSLKSEFFKGCDSEVKEDYIVFENREFKIQFSKYEEVIVVKYKLASIPPSKPNDRILEYIELADLTEKFLADKTIENFKALMDCNCKDYPKGILWGIRKPFNTYMKCNSEFVYNMRLKQDRYNKGMEIYKREMEVFSERQKYAQEVIGGLEELRKFKEAGWIIKLYGIRNKNGEIWYS